jgi:hypothetical protein
MMGKKGGKRLPAGTGSAKPDRRKKMSAFAPSHYDAPNQKEVSRPQLTQEELDKLQEIHELINLMLKELPVLPDAARSYAVSFAQAFPYAYSDYPMRWGSLSRAGSPQAF